MADDQSKHTSMNKIDFRFRLKRNNERKILRKGGRINGRRNKRKLDYLSSNISQGFNLIHSTRLSFTFVLAIQPSFHFLSELDLATLTCFSSNTFFTLVTGFLSL